jgi:hypothetical protein
MDSLYHCEHLQPFRSRSEALLPFPERNYWFAQTPTAARGLPLAAEAHCVVLGARRATHCVVQNKRNENMTLAELTKLFGTFRWFTGLVGYT